MTNRIPMVLLAIVLVYTGCVHREPHKGMENGMAGIIFFKTQMLKQITDFYVNEVGCTLWMDQADCRILRHGTLLLGFCQREESETQGCITFFYPEQKTVDRMYEKFHHIALGKPTMNPNYPIYNFFARDPEGRIIEFQYFTNEPDWAY